MRRSPGSRVQPIASALFTTEVIEIWQTLKPICFSRTSVGFWVTAAASVYPLNNMGACLMDPSPPERQYLTRPHAHQTCKSINESLPDVQHRKTQVVVRSEER